MKALISIALSSFMLSSGLMQAPCATKVSVSRAFADSVKQRLGYIKSASSVNPIEAVHAFKTILFSGDDSIKAFDNARETINEILVDKGYKPGHIQNLSLRFKSAEFIASSDNLQKALERTKPQRAEGCLMHMTSHGTKEGFVIRDRETISPKSLASFVNSSCGDKPTVLLISACYSGVFLDEESLLGPNRIILTAARNDRTSFGCGVENQYNFWDGCIIEHIESSETWRELSGKVQKCIEEKEVSLNYEQSFPQTYIGKNMRDFKISVAGDHSAS